MKNKKVPPGGQLEWGQSIGQMEEETSRRQWKMGENWKGNDWSVLAPCRDELGFGSGSISDKPSRSSYIPFLFFFSFPLEKKYKSLFQFSDSFPLFVQVLDPTGSTPKLDVNSNRLRSAALHLSILIFFFPPLSGSVVSAAQ